MQRWNAGTCTFTLRLVPEGPWMVRGQNERESFVDHRGQQNFRDILMPLLDRQNKPVLPASSLKGVLRSTAERILRSMQPNRPTSMIPLADDPFTHSPEGQDKQTYLKKYARAQIADSELKEWLEQQPADWFGQHPEYATLMNNGKFDAHRAAGRLYPFLSPASQLFGCTLHAGLVTLDDAHTEATQMQRRSHVAIDRFSQGVGAGPFLENLAPAGAPLVTTLTITNFALWQIGLLGLVFQELNRGYAALGGGTRKGQGHVRIDVPRVEVCYAGVAYAPPTNGIISAQALLANEPYRDFVDDLPPSERTAVLLEGLEPQASTDWRDEGLQRIIVEASDQLFAEAVTKGWVPWINAMTRENAPS